MSQTVFTPTNLLDESVTLDISTDVKIIIGMTAGCHGSLKPFKNSRGIRPLVRGVETQK